MKSTTTPGDKRRRETKAQTLGQDLFRYPGEIEPVTDEEYQHLLAMTTDVTRWAEEILTSNDTL